MTAAFPTHDPSWSLDSIFEGGIGSQDLRKEIKALEALAATLRTSLEGLSVTFSDTSCRDQWKAFFDDLFQMGGRLSECRSFCHGVASTHTDQPEALRMPALVEEGYTSYRSLYVVLEAKFRGLEDQNFEELLSDSRFQVMDLWLRELRRDADRAMDQDLEALAVELNRDGLHAWGRLYNEVSGRLTVEVKVDGDVKTLSVGQAKNLLEDPRKEVRKAAHLGLRKAWEQASPICASALNSLIGAQQTLYRRRGGDCLTYPLATNRVERKTVDAIMEAAREIQPTLARYLRAKARLLGDEKLSWADRYAPVSQEEKSLVTYQEAQTFIVEQVESFSPAMAAFCRMALANQWVEVEDRNGKAQGGYCTSLPISKEFRIFMTFGGTNSGVTTLAHELGHGYHFWVMKDLPEWDTQIPMGLAETASTLVEAIVEQAAMDRAGEEELLSLLDERLGRAVAFLMDIPARYELELALHEERATGSLHAELLKKRTEEIYLRHYAGGVEEVDDLFWASKLHFFLTSMPFYNFPYSFGYLFSRAVYKRAREIGPSFVNTIDELLRDTGRMTSEDLAKKYLDADIRESSFWLDAIGNMEAEIEEFEKLVNQRLA